MAAGPAHRSEMPSKLLAFALLVTIPLLNGVMAQKENVTVAPSQQTGADARMIRGDMISTTDAPDGDQGQMFVFPTLNTPVPTEKTTAGVTENAENEEITEKPAVNPETPGNLPPRGDNPNNKPKPLEDIVCVSKEAVEGKNAVSLKLKELSNCKDTQMKIVSVLQELCGEDCKMEIYQEDNTDEVLVSGKYVEDDVPGMTNKFNNDNIKDKTNVDEAVPRWGKKSKLVLVSLLLAGLSLAALLVAGYCLKTHRKTSKGVRLAESFQVDEENQANTLVSVAPLPQEPLDKPTVNGESPPENGTNPAPTTNGHSATQTQVADTEM